jgi:hypothetical protein
MASNELWIWLELITYIMPQPGVLSGVTLETLLCSNVPENNGFDPTLALSRHTTCIGLKVTDIDPHVINRST